MRHFPTNPSSSNLSNICIAPIAIPTKPNGGNHTALFAESAATKEAHVQTLKVINGLAHTGFRVIDDDGFFQEVRNFESDRCIPPLIDIIGTKGF